MQEIRALHAKQDSLFNRVEHREAIREGWIWKGRLKTYSYTRFQDTMTMSKTNRWMQIIRQCRD
jgi:hypothetical protein